ncbi:hypothetical protein GA0115242_127235 [Streptomyces sp. SolWspMP-5a-2]|nr:hypothetical protein GA0115242_127235 [Streptomyces sp. SolWspMP-5a-2]
MVGPPGSGRRQRWTESDVIELSTVIRDLRAELERAVAAAEGAALRFELQTIELEMSVTLERSAQAGAKVRFWVVDTNAEASVASASTQRIRLALQPALTGSETTYIHGRAEDHEE